MTSTNSRVCGPRHRPYQHPNWAVTELEDDLTAARESLRRAIRQANR